MVDRHHTQLAKAKVASNIVDICRLVALNHRANMCSSKYDSGDLLPDRSPLVPDKANSSVTQSVDLLIT